MKPLPLLAIAALVIAGGLATWHYVGPRENKPASAPPAVPVSAVIAKTQAVPIYLVGIGTVQAENAIEVHPQVGGILTAMPVREGQDVKKGDVVAIIDPRPLKAALDRAVAQRVQDQAQFVNAQADQTRYAALAVRDFASRQQLETQQSTVARLQGLVAADEASIEEAQINLGYAVVHSPLDGRISIRRVDPGNLIQANATGLGILSITQVHPISVLFTLPEGDLQRVRDAMAVHELPVLAESSDGSVELARGTLQTPDNSINTSTGTMLFKALFPNKEDHLTPGQFVSTRLQVDTANGVTVPHDAIQHSQDGLFVFAVEPDKTAKRLDVKLVYDDGKVAVVKDGLKDGQRVVTSGQSRIGPGTALALGNQDGAQPDGGSPTAQQPPQDQSASR